MLFLKSILVLLFAYSVNCEDTCVTYTFEEDFQNLFNDNVGMLCSAIQQFWVEGQYADIGLAPPHELSTTYVSPLVTSSCASSFDFTMSGGGVIEFTVFLSGESFTDQLSILVNQKDESGTDILVGNILVSPSLPGFVPGWSTQRITIGGDETFQGYISIMGAASESSLVLLDSFRYIPPGTDEDLCVLYDESTDDTTPSPEGETDGVTQETSDITSTTPSGDETTEEPEKCTTYNFESGYDVYFSNDNYLCEGFLPWQLDNYTSIGIESPFPESSVFITPHDSTSCINSFVFKMEPDGIVEANVYMDPVQALDHIIILAHRVTGREFDTTAGFKMYHPDNQVFVTGWNVIRFSLLELTSFDGYLIFIGSANSDSTVLVDSIRYIPPRTSPEDPSCNIYPY